MKRIVATTALVLLAACASSQDGRGPHLKPMAQPSEIIASELAFARLAQDRGQWTAFRETADNEAVMFVPQRVKAQDWLRGRADPATSVRWQPYQAWSSCDGTAGVTHGAWQNGTATGYFTTVWLRQRDGKYKWVLDHGDALTVPLPAPEMISAKIAECGGSPSIPVEAVPTGQDLKIGVSRDQTVQWSSTVSPDGARRISVKVWNGTAFDTVLDEQVAAEGQ